MSTSRLRRVFARTALASISLGGVGVVASTSVAVPTASAVAFPTGRADDPAVDRAVAALDALQAGDSLGYQTAIVALAQEIGWRAEVDPADLVAAWNSASRESVTVVLSALTQLGLNWRYATSKPGEAFDCSGLVRWAWSQAGVQLPASSSSIIRSMENTPLDQIEPGDVLWYPGHVMIALGVGDSIVQAVNRGRVLEVRSMPAKRRGKIRVIDPLG